MMRGFATALRTRILSACVLAALSVAVGGCSKPLGSVSGTVSYKGKPLTSGTVTFWGAENTPQSAHIDDEGYYKVHNLPPGEAKVTVATLPEAGVPLGPPMDAGKMGGPSGLRIKGDPKLAPDASASKKGSKEPAAPKKTTTKHVQLPDTYKDPEKTPLSYKVKSGPNKFDIDIPK